MAFDGTEGSAINRTTAGGYTSNYRTNNPGATLGHFYGKEILETILAQQGCVGIRIYYGEDGEGTKELVLVGADSSQNDMLDLIVDYGKPCPSDCSSANILNS